MELYVTQLIEDLEAAQQPVEPYVPGEEQLMEGLFDEVEDYVSGEKHVKICELIGFLPEQFPPSNRLNTNQLKRVFFALDQLLDSYNIDTNLPNKLPIKRKYELVTNELTEEVFASKHGFTHLEYCNYDVETCPFGKKYCDCKDFMFDNEKTTNADPLEDDELPF
jgi:hypothetical protein